MRLFSLDRQEEKGETRTDGLMGLNVPVLVTQNIGSFTGPMQIPAMPPRHLQQSLCLVPQHSLSFHSFLNLFTVLLLLLPPVLKHLCKPLAGKTNQNGLPDAAVTWD